MLITVSNLYPRPDQPTRGMFNAQLFGEMGKVISDSLWVLGRSTISNDDRSPRIPNNQSPIANNQYINICLVPSWKIWQWQAIRRWTVPKGEGSTTYLPVFFLPLIGRSCNGWFYYHSLKRFLLKPSPVINHPAAGVFLTSWLYPDAVAIAKLAKDLGAPVWIRVHGSDRFHLNSPYRRRLILEACREAKGVICNAKSVADYMAKRGVPADKIHLVPNGVDTSLFRYRGKEALSVNGDSVSVIGKERKNDTEPEFSSPLHNQEPATNNRPAAGGIILFVGNLVPIKGPDILLTAFSKISEQKPAKVAKVRELGSTVGGGINISLRTSRSSVQTPAFNDQSQITNAPHLLLIGSGPLHSQLERQAQKLGIADRVHFLGNRPHGEVALWMNAADVLCLTSRSEGMPNVVVEALVSGLPVVATAVGACPEMLAGEPAARVCRSEDVGALTDALKAVLELAVDREALAARHATRYSWRRQAETMLRLMGN